ncbi:MAG: dinitrogenase iron-molybdenum cofactor biosynthesis protein [Tissierellia bacterium]|jgi:predicted Fe-Mo cluster-binding NifX family protein|nr:NifB/NifX family molybdenum-iron cluster-binding protein [Bacillota bacterium]NLL22939.1 dinitrogenase iron-molybdenum cofactor biosynthesis protein [Tissierellia bacterium]
MKIVIPTEIKTLDANVCPSFGRAPYFLIYDTQTKESVYLDNTAAASAGGAGIKAAQIVLDSKAEVLLAPRLGENAAQVLIEAEIKILKTKDGTIKENIDAFLSDELAPLQEIHAGFHRHGER